MEVVSSGVREPLAVQVADVDGDGMNDLLLSTYQGMQWVRQVGANNGEEFETRHNTFGRTGVRPLVAGDVNGDGALDVVQSDFRGPKAYVNDGTGNFSAVERQFDATSIILSTRDSAIHLQDMDLDGDLDAVFFGASHSEGRYGQYWAENDGSGRFIQDHFLVANTRFFAEINGDQLAGDLDGDGDTDLVTIDFTSFRDAGPLEWHERTDDGLITREIELPTNFVSDSSLALGDANGDGVAEVIVRIADDQASVLVFELDRQTKRFVQRTEFTMGADAIDLRFADMDGDGDQDVVRRRKTEIDWFARNDQGEFAINAEPITSSNDGFNGFAIGDLNGDRLPDLSVVSESFDFVANYYNRGAAFVEKVVSVGSIDEVERMLTADLNGDAHIDLITVGSHLSWLPGANGQVFGEVVDLLPANVVQLRVADLDGDGDNEIIATDDENLYQLQNDGQGSFSTTTLGRGGLDVEAVDWDGDGDLDLLTPNSSFSDEGAQVWWSENQGDGTFSELALLFDLNSLPVFFDFADDFFYDRRAYSLQAVTVADGRMKIAVQLEQYTVDSWGVVLIGRETDGTAVVSPVIHQFRSDDAEFGSVAADTDGDGFDEIVSVLYGEESIQRVWADVTPDGPVERPIQELIDSVDETRLREIDYVAERADWLPFVSQVRYTSLGRFFRAGFYPRNEAIVFADLNNDGNVDIAAADDAKLFWAENRTEARDWNQDSRVDAKDIDLLSAAIGAGSMDANFDVNDDQAVDRADLDELVKNELRSQLADVNLDGVFNSSDLVLLFQSGKFELDEVAVWSEGDFNADGRFDTSDLVLAFEAGYQGEADDDD